MDEDNKRKHRLYDVYFKKGRSGYKMIRRFYGKYTATFSQSSFSDFRDLLHHVYTKVVQVNLSNIHKREENYIITVIKNQGYAILDKVKREQKILPESRIKTFTEDNDNSGMTQKVLSQTPEPMEVLEGKQLFHEIYFFRLTLKKDIELRIFNAMIDEKPRKEIAEAFGIKLNTLDTHIRRLRIAFAEHLRNAGYSYEVLKKFEK